MKKFFVFAMLCCMTLFANAQATDVPMATLQHGDEIKVFYGTASLNDAYAAAADSGDVITLSAGVFNGVTVQKSLKIIGNGFVTDEEKGIYPTIISESLIFSSRDAVNGDGETIKDAIGYNGTRIEGLQLNSVIRLSGKGVNGFEIVKCNINGSLDLYTKTQTVTVRQSRINKIHLSEPDKGQVQENLNILNSFISISYQEGYDYATHYFYNTSSTIFIDHSILTGHLMFGNMSNSILTGSIYSEAVVNNCIFIGNTPTVNYGTGNWLDKKLAGIFEEEMTNMDWDGVKTFKLKYPDTYIGTDGTQVGLYGGTYPFNPTPTVPQITESEIDTKVAADGKLKVRITVEAQTEY